MPSKNFDRDTILNRGVVEIIDSSEFIELLDSSTPLNLKMGFDPSAPDIHLGHVVGLRKLRQLQDLGHQVVLIVGDWTAQIGDPSGQSATRKMLDHKEVEANAETYLRQFFRIVDKSRTQVVWQSEWFGKFDLADVIRLSARFTVAQFLQREDFRRRWDAKRPIAITELLYPLLQAYDSVMIRSDVEFGGTDQKFNNLMGRDLQRADGQDPQVVLLTPLLVGLDGTDKMSKSLGNYVGIYEPANEMFAKLMSIPDELMETYFELTTDVPMAEVAQLQRDLVDGSVHPKTTKQRLAREVVTIYHGETAAESAQAEFDRIHRHRQLPSEIPSVSISNADLTDGKIWVGHLLTQAGFAKSTSEARRLVQQGGVRFDGEKVVDPATLIQLQEDLILQVGKRRFAQIKIG